MKSHVNSASNFIWNKDKDGIRTVPIPIICETDFELKLAEVVLLAHKFELSKNPNLFVGEDVRLIVGIAYSLLLSCGSNFKLSDDLRELEHSIVEVESLSEWQRLVVWADNTLKHQSLGVDTRRLLVQAERSLLMYVEDKRYEIVNVSFIDKLIYANHRKSGLALLNAEELALKRTKVQFTVNFELPEFEYREAT